MGYGKTLEVIGFLVEHQRPGFHLLLVNSPMISQWMQSILDYVLFSKVQSL